MTDLRNDPRNRDPQGSHRGAFMRGWTDAEHGTLYAAIHKRKTHQNMGNLFGWIFGGQLIEFKEKVWILYLEHALAVEDD